MRDKVNLSGLALGLTFTDERGLLIRLDAKDIPGLVALHKIGRMIRRPVKTEGYVHSEGGYLWLTIPLRDGDAPGFEFGNDPRP